MFGLTNKLNFQKIGITSGDIGSLLKGDATAFPSILGKLLRTNEPKMIEGLETLRQKYEVEQVCLAISTQQYQDGENFICIDVCDSQMNVLEQFPIQELPKIIFNTNDITKDTQ